jgi:hypothetical protein
MAEHTPGPWSYEESKTDGGNLFLAISSANAELRDSRDVAYLTLRQAEIRANARLIAAAPDMLAALQSVIHDLSYDEGRDLAASTIEQVRAAIRKATGADDAS